MPDWSSTRQKLWHGVPGLALAALLAPVSAVLGGCAQTPAPAPAVPAAEQAAALVGHATGLGVGRPCQADSACQVGQVRSLCVLGTCTGLLSTDQRPERAVVLERLQAAPAAVRTAAEPALLTALDNPAAAPWQRLAAAEGLAVILAADGGSCARRAANCATLERLAADDDGRVATAALLGLVRAKAWLNGPEQPLVRERLLRLRDAGTELVRAELLRALEPWLRLPDAEPFALQLALPLLEDPSAVVQQLAVRALAPAAARPDVAEALRTAAEQGDGALTYLTERALLQASAGGGER